MHVVERKADDCVEQAKSTLTSYSMFIIVIGTRASGKSAIKDYLIQKEGFKHVRLVLSGANSSSITSTGNNSNNNNSNSSGFRYKLDKLAGSVTNVVANRSSQHSTSDEGGTGSGAMKLQIPPIPPDFELGEMTNDGGGDEYGSGRTPAAVIEQSESLIGALDGSIGFSDPHRLLEHVTRHWREHFVTEDITTRTALEPFLKRPFVLLVSVDAPRARALQTLPEVL